MPKPSRKTETDSDSGPDDTNPPPSKKKAPTTTSASGDKACFSLSKMRQISVSDFRGRVFVNIREYYDDEKSGERRPGKKGIALTVDQWERLKEHMKDIDKAIKEAAD